MGERQRELRAERLAMEAPVKMLAPLLVFIFPCTWIRHILGSRTMTSKCSGANWCRVLRSRRVQTMS